MAGVPQLLGEL